jgi:hypothetical protein
MSHKRDTGSARRCLNRKTEEGSAMRRRGAAVMTQNKIKAVPGSAWRCLNRKNEEGGAIRRQGGVVMTPKKIKVVPGGTSIGKKRKAVQ